MKAVRHLLALVALALAATTASAQFVKGNEAVKVMPDGTKKVETPPLPARTASEGEALRRRRRMHGAAGTWSRTGRARRVHRGLRAAYGTCRKSTTGREASRLWVVKTGSSGLQCQYPDMAVASA
jgi:hypothetical protein